MAVCVVGDSSMFSTNSLVSFVAVCVVGDVWPRAKFRKSTIAKAPIQVDNCVRIFLMSLARG